ncbi:MAG: hypothetical protein WCO29_12185 [Nostocales cyanobacterium ELA583]|jgi:hypothetical protein
MSPHIQSLISLLETLPLNIQKQVVEHLQEYIQQLTNNLAPNNLTPTVNIQNNQPKIIPTDDYSSELSPEELEILNNCTEIPVWSPFDSIQ